MGRLGYTRYVAQGGDVGPRHGLDGPPGGRGLIGYHLNLLTAVLAIGEQLPKESEPERAAAEAAATFRQDGFGYFLEMATRPQTIGYALLDSPVALAAWLLDHDTDSYYKISRAFVDGEPVGRLTRDSIVDNITLYWLTGTAASAARSYWEDARALAAAPPAASFLRRSRCRSASPPSPARSGRRPGAGSRRSPTSPTSTRPIGAATSPPWEEPQLFSEEVRAAFRSQLERGDERRAQPAAETPAYARPAVDSYRGATDGPGCKRMEDAPHQGQPARPLRYPPRCPVAC